MNEPSIEGDTIYVAALIGNLMRDIATLDCESQWSRGPIEPRPIGNGPASIVLTHESGVRHRVTVERID